MTTIEMDLSVAGIHKAIKELNDYKSRLKERIDLLLHQLADEGCFDAVIRFESAQYDGDNDVRVTVVKSENGYTILASGNAVCFIEFGSGVYYNGEDSYAGKRPDGVAGIGQYGENRGRQDVWFYNGNPGTNGVSLLGGRKVMTHGNPAAMPMWYASQKIQTIVERFAKDVFL